MRRLSDRPADFLEGRAAGGAALGALGAWRRGQEAGGLSGAPVFERSTAVLRKLFSALASEVPIIGVGGIMSGADAAAKIDAGAKLVQIYSGFIYRGPDLIAEAAAAIAKRDNAR